MEEGRGADQENHGSRLVGEWGWQHVKAREGECECAGCELGEERAVLKASEANYFLTYVRTVLAKKVHLFPDGPNLLISCDALLRCQELAKEHPKIFTIAALQECWARQNIRISFSPMVGVGECF